MNEALVTSLRKRLRAPAVPAVDDAAKPGRLQHWRMEAPFRAVLVVTFSEGVVKLLRIDIWDSTKAEEIARVKRRELWK